jgi:hypothetical protein
MILIIILLVNHFSPRNCTTRVTERKKAVLVEEAEQEKKVDEGFQMAHPQHTISPDFFRTPSVKALGV